jgi:excisionase family DNA binding protein
MVEDHAVGDASPPRHHDGGQQPWERGPAELSTREAAATIGRSERSIRRAIASGELACVKRGVAYRIPREALICYAETLESPPSPRPLARIVAFPGGTDVAPLPEPLSSFIGRSADLATVLALLGDATPRLLTLTGPGGIGKTRLAMAAASAIAGDRFPDGVVFVALADLHTPQMVLPAIARALGLRERPGRTDFDQVRRHLRGKAFLLVLDNFEHLLPAGSAVAELLSEATRTTALVTSRAPLRVMGERELPVLPMTVASDGATQTALLASDAGRLFVERAREHDPSFHVDDDTAPFIADICARLDGLPLAIELAASRVRFLSPRQLADRLEPRLPLLTRGPRNAPVRHSTMRDAIAWSYELLSPLEQRLFRRLAVFSGGATLAAAEDVFAVADSEGSGTTAPDILDTVSSLTEQSLLVVETGRDGERRFRMLETIREYGLERLVAAGEEPEARAARAGFMLTQMSTFGPPEMFAANKAALDCLEAERSNLQAALTWLETHDPAAFVRLVGMLPSYWYACSHYQEAREWLERALPLMEVVTALDQARVFVGVSRFQVLRGEYQAAAAGFARGIPVLQAEGRAAETAIALMWQSGMAMFSGDDALAEASLAEACQVAERVDDARARATMLGFFLSNLGVAARARGDLDLAASRLQQALAQFQANDDTFSEESLFLEMGDLAIDRGDYALALAHYQTFLERMGAQGDLQIVEAALAGVARVATAWGRFLTAARLFSMADVLQQRLGLGMILPGDLAGRARDLATVHSQLGDAAFAAAWSEGQTFSLSAALTEIAALAAAAPSDVAASARGPRTVDALTERELDVLRLLAEHRSDREIGEALYLSRRTVSWHVRAILAKLDCASRGEAVTRARQRGLI